MPLLPLLQAAVAVVLPAAASAALPPAGLAGCNLTGTWHGHPQGGRINPTPIAVVESPDGRSFVADGKPGTVGADGATVDWGGLRGALSANTPLNATAPPCTRVTWANAALTFWCKEPYCEWTPPPPPPPSPPGPPPPPPPPGVLLPNVVFVITDDQDVLLGSMEFMPTLQRELVEQGTTLTNFFVTVPVCCPSRTSFLSGRYAHNNGAAGIKRFERAPGGWCGTGHYWKGPLGEHSIAKYMKAAGYVTGLFGKELNVVDTGYVTPGWDRYYALENECEYFGNSWADDGRRSAVGADVYMTTAIANASTEWIRAQRRTPARPYPLFAYIAPHAPHQPATPDVRYETAFSGLRAPRTPAWNLSAEDHHWLVAMQPQLTDAQAAESDEMFRRRLRALQSVDDLLAAVLVALDSIGELDNTVIIYSADHGYHLGQWRIPAHKELAYDTDLRVPFVVRGPGVRRNATVAAIGLNVDVAVTAADFGRYAIPSEARVDGRSLKPLLVEGADAAAAAWPRTEILFEHEGADIRPFAGAQAGHCTLNWTRPDGGSPANPTVPGLCSCGNPMGHWISSSNNTYKGLRLVNGSAAYKLVRYDDDADFHELFDLVSDPHELRNVYATAPRWLVEHMEARLEALRGCGAGPNATARCP